MDPSYGQFPQGPPPQNLPPIAPVRTTPMLLTPFVSIGRELKGIFAVPFPMIGGLLGTIGMSVAVYVLLNMGGGGSEAEAAVPEDEFMLEFEPGALAKLGEPPKDIPEKPVHEETRTPEDVVEEAVTDEEKPPIEDVEKEETKETKKDDKPPNPNKDAKVDDKNSKDNNPYDDIPNDAPDIGDPFGDPNGWADLAKDGDPWATSVMGALNNMKVPAYAAKLPQGKPYKFMLKICKDGKIDTVLNKQSSGNAELDGAIKGELMKLKIPKPPKKVLDMMPTQCVLLKYQFSWQQGKVK
jgi:hypothetical protein